MGKLNVDLSLEDVDVFNSSHSSLVLLNKSFIFGKNGAGKSSLCRIINRQFSNDFDVRIFTGLEGVLVDQKLNAVVLGEENEEIKKKVDDIDNKLEVLNKKEVEVNQELNSLNRTHDIDESGISKHPLLLEREKASDLKCGQERKIDRFYTDQARKIKENYQNQINNTNYNKNQFKNDIPNAKQIEKEEIDRLKTILSETTTDSISLKKLPILKSNDLLRDLNVLMQKTVQETFTIDELSESSEKKDFAELGWKLHNSGDICSYCGNIVTSERMEKLDRYFSSEDIELFQQELRTFKSDKVDKIKNEIDSIQDLDTSSFYHSFFNEVSELNKTIQEKKRSWLAFISILELAIDEKRDSLFSPIDPLSIEPILDFDEENSLITEMIRKNNEYSDQISTKHQSARNSLRLHYVAEALILKGSYKKDWQGYDVENFKLKELSDSYDIKNDTLKNKIISLEGTGSEPNEGSLHFVTNEIAKLTQSKFDLLEQTKNTRILANRINKKLTSVGKNNLRLEIVKSDNEIEHYQIMDELGTRSIDKISTGEKNIIAFLYFMEQLENSEDKKNKFIIFDDPMNSNDDTMQYLIITEIQKLYQGKYKNRFNPNNDFFICMTHNAHFYLNVQPQGNIKEKKKNPDNPTGKLIEVSKYDKNTFYWLENGIFNRILSETTDLSTHYELLWMELGSLYEQNMLNSMLNSMRRIIETYIHFNKIHPDRFYNDMDEHRKLFNVNSHAVDDLSAELIGKNKEDVLNMFKEIFYNNDADEHYDNYKKRWTLFLENQ